MKNIKNFFTSKNGAFALSFALAMFAMVLPETAFAAKATTFTTLNNNIIANFTSFKGLAFSFGYLIGVILFVSGIWLIYKDSKQPGQDHAKKGGIALLIGVALLVAPTLIDIFGASTVGDTAITTNVTGNY